MTVRVVTRAAIGDVQSFGIAAGIMRKSTTRPLFRIWLAVAVALPVVGFLLILSFPRAAAVSISARGSSLTLNQTSGSAAFYVTNSEDRAIELVSLEVQVATNGGLDNGVYEDLEVYRPHRTG